MGEWQTMDTFPEDGDDYLVTDYRVFGGFPQVVYWDGGRAST